MPDRITPPWPIRKQRDQAAEEEFHSLKKEVPDGLRATLLDFVEHWYFPLRQHAMSMSIWELDARLSSQRVRRLGRLVDHELPSTKSGFVEACEQDEEMLLNAVDHALQSSLPSDGRQVEELCTALCESRSTLDIMDFDGQPRLTYRQPPELEEVFEMACTSHQMASMHLREAWAECFGRDEPDPSASYQKAVKAVEAAAKPIIIPNEGRATLSKMITAMEAKPEKWETCLDRVDTAVETIIGMMKIVWNGAKDRHGEPNNDNWVSVDECEMVLHAATVLVHWFSTEHYVWKV